jgi:hypothetical protein
MYNSDTDLLFPPRVIPDLKDCRGRAWRKIVKRAIAAEDDSYEKLAFLLIMVRLNGCASCSADSFRAMQGCTVCAKQSLKRFRGTDDELTALYNQAVPEVEQYFEKNNKGTE